MVFNPWGRWEPLRYWDRARGRMEQEQVYGDRWVRLFYDTTMGRILSDAVLSRPLVSQAYGWTQDLPLSARKIPQFIRQFQIPMEEYEEKNFATFNEFFTRKFKPGARSFHTEPGVMPAFAEARYFAFPEVKEDQTFPIKGRALSAATLLERLENSTPFIGGPLLLARLCPVDYHRYHYPDDGQTLKSYRLPGKLHSVNPVAIRQRNEILSTNERHVSILQTKNFGKLAYIEVGATCVGRIRQTHPETLPFNRGDEKGLFLFGGSTVIVIGEKGAWKPDIDLIQKTQEGVESLVRLGEKLATRL